MCSSIKTTHLISHMGLKHLDTLFFFIIFPIPRPPKINNDNKETKKKKTYTAPCLAGKKSQ